jgi:hypothetical protein
MKEKTLRFEVDGFAGGIESVHLGKRVEIRVNGLTIMFFDRKDITARNFVIASLRRLRLKGKDVARMCAVSEAKVSDVHQLYLQGGFKALVYGGPGGTKPRLAGKRREKAVALRKGGKTLEVIAKKMHVSVATAGRALKGIPRGGAEKQQPLPGVGAPGPKEPKTPRARQASTPSSAGDEEESAGEPREPAPDCTSAPQEPTMQPALAGDTAKPSSKPEELLPGVPLPAGPAWHPCRYAGTLLICAALNLLGLRSALLRANVQRPESAVYDADQMIVTMMAGWTAGYGSLEAMHERDARALGVVLGLERCPCVRTAHRAIAQMVQVYDPVVLQDALARSAMGRVVEGMMIFGADGHVKAYSGPEPIDKGWDTKRRMAVKTLADVLIHDERGRTVLGVQVGAGDKLSKHVVVLALRLRSVRGDGPRIVLVFDRGGFSFAVLNRLAAEGFGYATYVPATVSMPSLDLVAPADDGVGEQPFVHKELDHAARLLVERDGSELVPAVTNLPVAISAADAFEILRSHRGAQENAIKASRAFAHIDRLVDRGGATRAPDDRLVNTPAHQELVKQKKELEERLDGLEREHPKPGKETAQWRGSMMVAEFELAVLDHRLKETKEKVPRVELEPEAERSWLKTVNRELLAPLKQTMDNARRWLLEALGPALSPSDHEWDHETRARTLLSLLRAPGAVRFSTKEVEVELELPLPPQPHARLAEGLERLCEQELVFNDGARRLRIRLAARPIRQSLPSAQVAG